MGLMNDEMADHTRSSSTARVVGPAVGDKEINIIRTDFPELLLRAQPQSCTDVSVTFLMEAEFLAATSLLVEGIQLKQLLQFLLGDEGGLGSNVQVQMRLRLGSTSAQSFFNRHGPGRAKHLSTRLLWSQQAMRKKWFLVERIFHKREPA
jgi:hypothetical protein